jgi:DNA-binding beta-propeller fold protein YncE
MYKYKRGVGAKCFLLLVFNAFSLILPAQTPMFTTGIDLVGSDQFLLANKGTKSVTLIDKSGRLVKEWLFDETVTGQCLSKGTVFVTSSFGRGWLTAINLGTGKVMYKTETGMGARSPIVNKDGSRIYIFNQFKTTVSELDSKSGKVLRQTKVLREPVAGALTPDGKYLFVNNFLPEQQANVDIVAAQVSVIDLSKFEVVKNIRLDNGSNALRGICIPPDGRYVFVTHNLGRFQVPTSQLQQGWMNTSAVSVINVANLSLEGALLMDEPDRGAAGIWGIACSEDKLFVTHSGTHDVSIVDLKIMLERLEKYPVKTQLSYDLKFMYGIRKRLPLVGNGPRSISLANGKLYIPTYFSDTLNVVDIATETITPIAYNTKRKESAENIGEKVFNDASYCYQNWQSCNGCHPGEARTDGMNWDLMNDGIGNPKNCKSMLYSHVTPPSMISGIREKAEIAVRRGFTHIQFAQIPEDLALCVDKYLMSLRPVPSPFLENGKLTEKAERGKKVFEKLNCGYCHSGPYFTDMQMHRIGDGVEFEAGWDTPSLMEVWRTAPYLFDGRAGTLKDVFSVYKHGINEKVSEQEIDELVEYVNSL